MTPHWRECEAPLRRKQRDGADETILCRPAKLRFAFPPPEQTQPLPQGGLAFPPESRGAESAGQARAE